MQRFTFDFAYFCISNCIVNNSVISADSPKRYKTVISVNCSEFSGQIRLIRDIEVQASNFRNEG